MIKQHSLLSPFGEVLLRVHPDHTHIQGADPLAGDWGLGWWHARQAGDEAVFGRQFWRGHLGRAPKAPAGRAEVDAWVGSWAFEADLPLETTRLTAGHRSRVHAYTQGFNQARKRGRNEDPWTPEDCHLLVRTAGFLEWWETRAPQAAFLLEAWRQGLSWEKILDLWPGLGPAPDPVLWENIEFPSLPPEALGLIQALRRYRRGPAWAVPSERAGTGALLGACYVSDVTEPGLPFWPVRIETESGSVRGLSHSGHPGFLAGRTRSLAWHAVPVADDTVDVSVQGDRTVELHWAGERQAGTLGALLAFEDSATVAEARERTEGVGSATLDIRAADRTGRADSWALGVKWLRANPRDAWLPRLTQGTKVGPRATPPPTPIPAKTAATLEAALSDTRSTLVGPGLALLRFLLPDSEAGHRLRRWTGVPEKGAEAKLFEDLYAQVLEEFWSTAPFVPDPQSDVVQALAPHIDAVIQAPHSAWFPSSEKNRRLAEAVRRAFAGPSALKPNLLGRRALKPCWTEVHGTKPRVFASTVAIVVDFGEEFWRVFLSDDETEVPSFHRW